MKKSVFPLLCLMLLFSACSPASTELAAWEQTANLTAAETKEALYEAALGEDVLRVFTVSTRMLQVAKAFEAAYPGLLVEVSDLRGEQLISDVKETIDSGQYACDIMFLTDVNGALTNDLIPNGYAHKYVPHDMADKLIPNATNEALMPLFTEAIFIHYNPTQFDTQPIHNFWELTEEAWAGKVYAPNPTQSVTTFAMYTMFIKHNDLMEAAYEEHYGKTFSSETGESAALTFIRKLVENGLVIVNSSDEVSDAVGLPGSEPALGLMVSSKLRLNNIGYHLDYATGVAPFDGVASSVHIMMAGGAKSVNTAKLFIRFIFGETDGTGAGYQPYLQEGVWAMRSDVKSEEDTPIHELALIYSDEAYTYEQQEAFETFWVSLFE